MSYSKKEKRSLGCCAFIVAFLVIGFTVSFVSMIVDAIFESNYTALDHQAPPAIGAEKLVGYYEEDQTYTKQYIPEELLADSDKEVAAVIYLTKGKEVYGYYSGGGGAAYIQTLQVQWYDLSSQTVIAEKTFEGGLPPLQTTKDGSHSGSEPREEEVTQWILQIAKTNLP